MVAVAYVGCWAVQVQNSAKALAGNTLFTYGQSTEVCAFGGRVTSIKVYTMWNETRTVGWSVTKDPTAKTFNVSWEGRGLAQFYFLLGSNGWNVQTPTTCLQLRLNANGHSRANSGSCNLS